MTEEQEMMEDDSHAAWAHQYDLESQQFRDENDWLELQLTITTQIQEYKDELKDCERGRW